MYLSCNTKNMAFTRNQKYEAGQYSLKETSDQRVDINITHLKFLLSEDPTCT